MAPWVPFVQTLKLACLVRLHVCLVCQHNTNMIAELSDAANVGSLGAPSLATVSEGAFYATDGEFHTTQVCIRPKVKPVVPRQPPVAPAARRLREQLYGELLLKAKLKTPACSRIIMGGTRQTTSSRPRPHTAASVGKRARMLASPAPMQAPVVEAAEGRSVMMSNQASSSLEMALVTP